MIRGIALALVLSVQPLAADDLPALYSVTGVAANDVLNIRAAPDPTSEIIGTLAPNATGVEVTAESDGWASVNAGERAGYVAARFLQPVGHAPWYRLEHPITCAGTEPFWTLQIDPQAQTATFLSAESENQLFMPFQQSWRGEAWSTSAAISFGEGMVVLRREECSDHMSERSYGIQVDFFLNTGSGHRISGCCVLSAD